jgi:hypothetical protein
MKIMINEVYLESLKSLAKDISEMTSNKDLTKMKKSLFLLYLSFLPAFLFANDYELGQKLVNKLWRDYKNNNVHSMSHYISPAFQETIPALQIRRNAKQELASVKQLHIYSFALKSLRVKRQGSNLITTYFRQLDTIVNNQHVILPFAIRLTVWQKIDGKWMWIAHQGGS